MVKVPGSLRYILRMRVRASFAFGGWYGGGVAKYSISVQFRYDGYFEVEAGTNHEKDLKEYFAGREGDVQKEGGSSEESGMGNGFFLGSISSAVSSSAGRSSFYHPF
jgi:hypothetical protein